MSLFEAGARPWRGARCGCRPPFVTRCSAWWSRVSCACRCDVSGQALGADPGDLLWERVRGSRAASASACHALCAPAEPGSLGRFAPDARASSGLL